MFTTSDIEKYFNSEKQESILFFVIGIAGIIIAIIFIFFFKTNFYKGAAIPLMLIGLMLGIVGFTVYKRSDDDRKRNVYAYGLNPTELQQKEIPRMKTVMKNFIVYRWVEIVLALAGAALFLFFKDNTDKLFWKGLGLTLAFMALIALTADYFAEKRGKIYLKGLQEFVQS